MLASKPAMSQHEQRFELLADLGAMIAGEALLDELLATLAQRVAHALGAQRATLWLIDSASGEIRSRVATLPELSELRVPVGHGVVGYVAREGVLVNISDASADPRWATDIARATGYRPGSMLTVPIIRRGQIRGVLQVLGKNVAGSPAQFDARDEEFAATLAEQVGRALDYTSLRGTDETAGLTLRSRFNHVIGDSPAISAVYDTIAAAARTDATVLLRGETGTGKGLLAHAIAINSDRRDAPFVHIDCTTLPAGLVESELFGHERGAYTGADARVIGKVEAARGGTLFLDEIGELPLALQAKLLRFVQSRQFERVGGRETLTADVRLIAATNRDLAVLAATGEFRSDLYFRLRVIEIELPSLRTRGVADIVALAQHFLQQFMRRYKKRGLQFSSDALRALGSYDWPGNVRELENAVERAVVLSQGADVTARELRLDPRRTTQTFAAPGVMGGANATVASGATVVEGASVVIDVALTLEQAERAFATEVLKRCDGNQTAAARRLDISRNKLARLLRTGEPDEP